MLVAIWGNAGNRYKYKYLLILRYIASMHVKKIPEFFAEQNRAATITRKQIFCQAATPRYQKA
jgi:hypothetical protein